MLIEAKDLVNGATIMQAEKVERIDYFHVELESHDVILGEGAPAESFIYNDSRSMFQNAREFFVQYPEMSFARAGRPFAPRRDAGFEIEAARRSIAARAGIALSEAEPGALRGWLDGKDSDSLWAGRKTAAIPRPPCAWISWSTGASPGACWPMGFAPI